MYVYSGKTYIITLGRGVSSGIKSLFFYNLYHRVTEELRKVWGPDEGRQRGRLGGFASTH